MKIKNVLLVTNLPAGSADAEYAAQEIAIQHNAKLFLLDTISTPFKPMGKVDPAQITGQAIKTKRAYLEHLDNRIGEEIETEVFVKTGTSTSQEIIAAVQEHDIDIVVRYMKGIASRATGKYGHTASLLIEKCPVPVLFVDRPLRFKEVTAFVNLNHTTNTNMAILRAAESIAGTEAHVSVVALWEFIPMGFAVENGESKKYLQTHYNDKLMKLAEDCFTDTSASYELVGGSPTEKIPEICKSKHTDVAVLGCGSSYPSRIRIGNIIKEVVDELDCALLAVKPLKENSVQQIQVSRKERSHV